MRLTSAVLALVLGSVACEDTDPGDPVASPQPQPQAVAEAEATRTLAGADVTPRAALLPLPALDVTVVNPASNPVNARLIGTASVTGSVTLLGTPEVTATISSLPPVSLAGTPTVAVAPKITDAMLAETRITIPAGDLRVWFLDAAQYEEVRVALRVPSLSNTMTFDAFTGSLNIEHVELTGVENHTRTYRVPGTRFGVMISNERGSEPTDVTIAVADRDLPGAFVSAHNF